MGPRHSEWTHAIPTWSLISHGLGGVCKAVQNQALPSQHPSHPKLGVGTTHWASGTLGLHSSGLLAWTLGWWAWASCPFLFGFHLQTQGLLLCPVLPSPPSRPLGPMSPG